MSTAISETAYNYKVVRQFAIMTVVWESLGWARCFHRRAAGVALAQFRPAVDELRSSASLHTNAVIFAFGGCAPFATSYYVVQRTCQTRLFSDGLAAFTFWGWQAVIVLAVITLPQGFTSSKEYAELEWPIDILITLVWVSYIAVFFGTIMKRKAKHIYVGNWFFGAFILGDGDAAHRQQPEIPVSWFKSYSIYSGRDRCDGAVVVRPQRRGLLPDHRLPRHDVLLRAEASRASGVFLSPVDRPLLGADHPYIWAGPHHLHYTALPDWAQSPAW